jgi:CRISPR-associated protein Cmr6
MPLRQSLKSYADANPVNLRSNAGLWIDVMFPGEKPEAQFTAPHLRKLENLPLPEGYTEAFALRERALGQLADAGRATLFDASATGRFIVGLGSKGALELGITLDRTWGVPYLPGTALKGLASSAAHRARVDGWQKPKGWPAAPAPKDLAELSDHQVLFGTTTQAGVVTFHDAWWRPAPIVPLHPDTMTVHHPEYYQGSDEKIVAPTDTDEPVPIPFLSCTGVFLCAIEGPPTWVEVAVAWLKLGLETLGLGAKTSSGYGRFDCVVVETPTTRERRLAREGLETQGRQFRINQAQPFIDALVRAARARLDADFVRKALNVLSREHRERMLDRAESALKSAGHDADADWLREVARQPAAVAPAAPVQSPAATAVAAATSAPASPRRTRVIYRADKKSEKRFELEDASSKKRWKNQFVEIDDALLAEIRQAGAAGLEVDVRESNNHWAVHRCSDAAS